MPETESISWRDLPGNKYIKALDPAMCSDAGYVNLQRVRKKGEDKRRFCNVQYDKTYLLEIVARKLVKPLFVLGKDNLIDLIQEAWDKYEQDSVGST